MMPSRPKIYAFKAGRTAVFLLSGKAPQLGRVLGAPGMPKSGAVAKLDSSPRIVDGGATPSADRKC